MSPKTPITVAHGDGIGPGIMEASLRILREAGAAIGIETIEVGENEVGEKVYLIGNTAERVHHAWLRTAEDGVHNYDIFAEGVSKQKAGTKEFPGPVVARLGKNPEVLKAISSAGAQSERREWPPHPARVYPAIEVVGVDLCPGSRNQAPQAFGDALQQVRHEGNGLTMIDSRGAIGWPGGMSETCHRQLPVPVRGGQARGLACEYRGTLPESDCRRLRHC